MNLDARLGSLKELAAVFPEAKITEQTLVAYLHNLQDVSDVQLQKAVTLWIRNGSPFFPKPCQILEMVRGEGVTTGWDTAWQEVQTQVKSCGTYTSPKFSSPITARAVKVIGWLNICNSPISGEGTLRAQFREVFNAINKREDAKVESAKVNMLIQGKLSNLLQGGKK